MTLVRFSFDRSPISVRVQPYRRWVDGERTIHVTQPREYKSATSEMVVDLPVTTSMFCLRIQEGGGLGGTVRFVAVPNLENQTDPLEYADLVDVNPATLLPSAEPTAAWYAALGALAAEVGGPSAPRGYTHQQTLPSTVWDITHNLGFDPAGFVVQGSNGIDYWPGVTYLVPGVAVRLSLPDTTSGTAYLS